MDQAFADRKNRITFCNGSSFCRSEKQGNRIGFQVCSLLIGPIAKSNCKTLKRARARVSLVAVMVMDHQLWIQACCYEPHPSE
ncbi:hypothetical protein DsansV1_C08g0083541 [Dioscorea sansibarensis]